MNKITIIMYHYVRDLKKSKILKNKRTRFKGLSNFLNYLQKHYNNITPKKLINAIEKK